VLIGKKERVKAMQEHNINPDESLNNKPDKDTKLNKLNPVFNLEKSGIGIEEIKSEAEQCIKQGNEATESKGLFTVKTASRWIEQAKTRPIPQMLFGEFWFEGELCILFADTNLGKSILAVQIGNSISKGEQIRGFKMENPKQPILYFDFELSDKQFENRYSINFEQHYNFDENFIRVEINPDAVIPENKAFEDFLNHSLELSIIETGAKVLIIDNLTYLKSETEKAKDALPLMKHLKALKNKYGLSILTLAHTPKRDLSKPITRNDLQGSKMLINFCDCSFSIGESHTDKNLRYLKQIKARSTEVIFDSENVCICQIDKPYNFLQFEFLNFGIEREHLKQHTEQDKESQREKVIELKQQGRSLREIGAELGISHMKVSRILKDCNIP
jgi:archaellum biogenesis ATPase FlaH